MGNDLFARFVKGDEPLAVGRARVTRLLSSCHAAFMVQIRQLSAGLIKLLPQDRLQDDLLACLVESGGNKIHLQRLE